MPENQVERTNKPMTPMNGTKIHIYASNVNVRNREDG